jgi:histone deacetylase 6
VRDVERTIRAKEQLAEGLHLIDFEQLKIENTNLNEKIEERNEDLAKLRRKINTTVQILTHVREKLQFVARDNAALQAQLEEDSSSLSSDRDALLKLKAERDAVRARSTHIQATTTFVTAPSLLEDLRQQKDLKDDLSIEIGGLRKRWEETKERNERMTQRLAASLSGSVPASPSARSLAGKAMASHRSQHSDVARAAPKDASAIMGAPSAASLISPLASPKAVRFNA